MRQVVKPIVPKMSDNHVCHFLESTRGGQLLCLNNYIMRLNFHRCGKTYWKCKTRKCSSTAITKDGNLILARENHNHGVNTTEIQLKRSVNMLKRKAVEELDLPMRDVYDEVVQTHYSKDYDGAAIPEFSTVRSMLYSARHNVRNQCSESMETESDEKVECKTETSCTSEVIPHSNTLGTVPSGWCIEKQIVNIPVAAEGELA